MFEYHISAQGLTCCGERVGGKPCAKKKKNPYMFTFYGTYFSFRPTCASKPRWFLCRFH